MVKPADVLLLGGALFLSVLTETEQVELIRNVYGAGFAAIVGMVRVLRVNVQSRLKFWQVVGEVGIAFSAGFVTGALITVSQSLFTATISFNMQLAVQALAGFTPDLAFRFFGKRMFADREGDDY